MCKSKKLLFILLLTFMIFTLSSSVFAAGSKIDINYDYLYDYKLTTNDDINNLVSKIEKDSRVTSGDYYYFIGYNRGDYCYNAYLVKKDSISNNLNLVFGGWSGNLDNQEHFYILLSPNDLKSEGNLILYSGNNGYAINKYENSNNNYYGILITGYFDSNNKVYTFPFATNFEGKIIKSCSNDSEKVFFKAPIPLVALVKEEELTQVMKEILVILPMILVVMVSYLGLRKALSMLSMLLRQS